MPKVTVRITLKPSLLDTQGRTIESALHRLGFTEVDQLRVGKIIEMRLPDDDADSIRTRVSAMCDRLLANPVMESYRIEVGEES
ncbi:MAG: phosphoribosylformylglycinamidine synthase subunit PurS [Capsulimonadales bacterium]|nr:phosphoribosylformylglycinamidine synthase subunit PurS [Capsulimonadales bacterium]